MQAKLTQAGLELLSESSHELEFLKWWWEGNRRNDDVCSLILESLDRHGDQLLLTLSVHKFGPPISLPVNRDLSRWVEEDLTIADFPLGQRRCYDVVKAALTRPALAGAESVEGMVMFLLPVYFGNLCIRQTGDSEHHAWLERQGPEGREIVDPVFYRLRLEYRHYVDGAITFAERICPGPNLTRAHFRV